MNTILEKEARGAITKEKASLIEQYATTKGWKKHGYKQISIYCNTDHIEQIGSVEHGNSRLIIDIRDDAINIKIKLGNALAFERQEHTLKCSRDCYEAVAVLLKVFGVEEGFVRTFDRTDYVTDDGVQLTIKLNCPMGDHFEIERNSDALNTINTYNSIIENLHLVTWSREELSAAILNDHNKVRAQNILEFLRGEL